MFYLNDVRIIGRATRDAELKQIGENSKVATFRLVSNRRVKKRNEEYTEKSTFIDCEAWGQRAEYVAQYVKRGTPVLVQGQLETDEWETNEGQKRSKIKIYCNSVQAERPRDDTQTDEMDDSEEPVAATASTATSARSNDDIPF